MAYLGALLQGGKVEVGQAGHRQLQLRRGEQAERQAAAHLRA